MWYKFTFAVWRKRDYHLSIAYIIRRLYDYLCPDWNVIEYTSDVFLVFADSCVQVVFVN